MPNTDPMFKLAELHLEEDIKEIYYMIFLTGPPPGSSRPSSHCPCCTGLLSQHREPPCCHSRARSSQFLVGFEALLVAFINVQITDSLTEVSTAFRFVTFVYCSISHQCPVHLTEKLFVVYLESAHRNKLEVTYLLV